MAMRDGFVWTALILLWCIFGRFAVVDSDTTANPSMIGPTGERGPPGMEGEVGATGDRGTGGFLAGLKGPMGATGHMGQHGGDGQIGLNGTVGLVGGTGDMGADSKVQGSTGESGGTGDMGPTGGTGATGEDGPVGATGEEGPRGHGTWTGVQGEDGPFGATGYTGERGSTGPVGLLGPVGEIGDVGYDGDEGAIGESGLRGPPGFLNEDVDQCVLDTSQCQQTCNNLRVGYECACRNGYILLPDKVNCTDIDECLTSNGDCEQICKNTLGSFMCSCVAGYTLSHDRHTCIDVNECCGGSPSKCSVDETCINSLGGYSCLHKSRVYVPEDRVLAAAMRQEDDLLNRRIFIGLITWLSVLTLLTLVCLLLFWFAEDGDGVTSAMRRDLIADRKFRRCQSENSRYVFPRLSTNMDKNVAGRDGEEIGRSLVQLPIENNGRSMGQLPTENKSCVDCNEIQVTLPTTTENVHL